MDTTAGTSELDPFVEAYHRALDAFVAGDPEPLKATFSRRGDVTLANPFGPPLRGWQEAAAAMERAATYYRDGRAVGFDTLASCASGELAYLVEVERFRARMGGGPEMADVVLRVTSVLRREDGVWRVLHRHADPITTARPPESVIQA